MRYKILVFNIVVVILGLLLFSYWLFIDELLHPPLVFNIDIQNMAVDQTVYRVGDRISIYSDFCKNRDADAISAWSLVDTIIRIYPTTAANIPAGCYSGWFSIVTVPPDTPPGDYYLQGTSVVEINPLRKVTYNYKSDVFLILE